MKFVKNTKRNRENLEEGIHLTILQNKHGGIYYSLNEFFMGMWCVDSEDTKILSFCELSYATSVIDKLVIKLPTND